jgi:hypothetical protein
MGKWKSMWVVVFLLGLVLTIPSSQLNTANLPEVACDKLTLIRGQDIYLVDPETFERTLLVHSPQSLWTGGWYTGKSSVLIRWAPDGTKLAFQALDSDDEMYPYPYLYVVNANGSGLKSLTTLHWNLSSWMWASDSEHIITHSFPSTSGTQAGLGIIDASTAQVVCSVGYRYGYEVPACNLSEGDIFECCELKSLDSQDSNPHPLPLGGQVIISQKNGSCIPSPNGAWSACRGEDNTVQILDMNTGQFLKANTRAEHFFWAPSCEAVGVTKLDTP